MSEINIKPSHHGEFTSYCNGKVTNECIARGKRSPSAKVRKLATFASNARKWKHEDGGKVEKYADGKSIYDLRSGIYDNMNSGTTDRVKRRNWGFTTTELPLEELTTETVTPVSTAVTPLKSFDEDWAEGFKLYDENNSSTSPTTSTGTTATTAVIKQGKSSDPRGFRNNNPGNMIFVGKGIVGQTGKDDKGFGVYDTLENGIAANIDNMGRYFRGGTNTIRKIITKWCPPNAPGNTPEGVLRYINFVTGKLGVGADDVLDFGNDELLSKLMSALFRYENGKDVDMGAIQRGIQISRQRS